MFEQVIVIGRSGKIGVNIHPCISFSVENIGFEPVAENQKILIADPEMIYRLGYFAFRFHQIPILQARFPSLV